MFAKEMEGENYKNLVGPMAGLAGIYMKQERYKEAEKIIKRAIEIKEKNEVIKDRDMVSILELMASLYRNTGRKEEAEDLEKRARKIRNEIDQSE